MIALAHTVWWPHGGWDWWLVVWLCAYGLTCGWGVALGVLDGWRQAWRGGGS